MHIKTAGVLDQQCKNTPALAGAKFKTELLAYNNANFVPGCSKLHLAAFHLGHTP